MSIKKIILITLAALVIVIVALVGIAFNKIYTPTEGKRIGAYPKPQKALLVIDVQEDYTGLRGKQPVPYKNVEEQIAAINRLIDHASITGTHVVYIRQIFDNNILMRFFVGRTIEGLPGTELDSRINVINGNDFTKKISDSFSNPALESFLILHQVGNLYLVGLDAAYCVHKTALGALNRGYRVTVVTDAILARDDMSNILKRYEKDGIAVTTSKELVEE
jgi:nicotinamidase/pyrazinamidase